MKLREQKNKIKALETSVTKLEQDLRSREAAFDRVHGSVNKLVEDMLLEEYPEEYVQNNSRKWLKNSTRHYVCKEIIAGQWTASTRNCEISP